MPEDEERGMQASPAFPATGDTEGVLRDASEPSTAEMELPALSDELKELQEVSSRGPLPLRGLRVVS